MMNAAPTSDLHERLRELLRRAEFAALEEAVRWLPDAVRETARIRRLLGRSLVLRGYFDRAFDALNSACALASPVELELIRIELANISITRQLDFHNALAEADGAIEALTYMRADEAVLAEAELTRARIVFSAAAHFFTPRSGTLDDARHRLDDAAGILAEHGCVDEAFSARMISANRAATVDARVSALG